MCGECDEQYVLEINNHDFEAASENINLIELKHFWHEAPDFFSLIPRAENPFVKALSQHQAKIFSSGKDSLIEFIEIAFCHLFEKNIFTGFNASNYSIIMDFFGDAALTEYFAARKKAAEGTIWANLGEQENFTSREHWEEFTCHLTGDIGEIETLLDVYLKLCTTESGDSADKEFPTPTWEHLSIWLPALYCSLCILGKHDSRNPILKRLALARPGICDFAGASYWLARKAFFLCIQETGIDFIISNFSDIRYLLIGYAVLKTPFTESALHLLRTQVQSQATFQPTQIEQDDLLEIIDRKIQNPAWLDQLFDVIEEGFAKPLAGGENRVLITTGFSALDGIFHGFEPGELTIIGASSTPDELDFCQNLLLNLACGSHPVSTLLWSAKMPLKFLVKRLLCMKTSLPQAELEKYQEKVEECGQLFKAMPIAIINKPYPKLENIKEEATKAVEERNTRVLLLDVSLSMISYESTICHGFMDALKKMKAMAKKLKLAVVCFSQNILNVDPKSGEVAPLTGLAGDWKILESFDNVIAICRVEDSPHQTPPIQNLTKLTVVKQITGSTGFCYLNFSKETGLFRGV